MRCEDVIRKKLGKLIPGTWREEKINAISHLMGKSDSSTGEVLHKKAEDFFWKQLIFVTALLLLSPVLILGVRLMEGKAAEEMLLTRNEFGGGDRKIPLVLKEKKEGGRQENYEWTLSEVRMKQTEKKKYADRFFRILKREVRGKNRSLSEVSKPLDFQESITGYPFEISYRVKDPDYIFLDGTLSPQVSQLTAGDSLSTGITVTARYEDWILERSWKVRLVCGAASKKKDPFQELKEFLCQIDRKRGLSREIVLSGQWEDYLIEDEKSPLSPSFVAGIVLCLGFSLPAVRIWMICRQGQEAQKQAEKDFPSIVHRLTLYLGSGLSFMSAVDRISKDYCRVRKNKGKRYAYEKILMMDRQMKAGISQTQACRRWSSQFPGSSYQKLALILIQSFTRGSREAREMMDKEEAAAFRLNVDRARKEGEEASTKLLFPMIIMLGEVTLLVMLPAILQFRNY